MISLTTCDNNWYYKEDLAPAVISEMQTSGQVVISTCGEGPDLEANTFFKVLDDVCQKFNFDKSKITIMTANKIQSHPQYKVIHFEFQWVKELVAQYSSKYSKDHFLGKKEISNHFASFNNRPTWYRICLVEHLSELPVNSLLSLNISPDSDNSNSVDYNKLFKEVGANEFFRLVPFVQQGSHHLPVRQLTYANGFGDTLTDLAGFYNDFFVDVVCNTFTVGNTYYMDEKEARPMFCCTPFISYAACGHLANLRRDGFKTFSWWWDESYDEYSGPERVRKINKLLTSLSKMSATEVQTMYNDMLVVLEHNHDHLVKKYGKK